MSLVACGETNSTEEEETATEMRPDIDQTYEITIEDLIIKENDKEIYRFFVVYTYCFVCDISG